MARLVQLQEFRSYSTSPTGKMHLPEEIKLQRVSTVLSPSSTTAKAQQSKTSRKPESIRSKRNLAVGTLGSKLESLNHIKLKFKSPRLLRKINLLEHIGKPKTTPELTVSSTFNALNALKTLAEEDLINRSELMQIYKVLYRALLYPRSQINSGIIGEVMGLYTGNQETDMASEHEDVPYYCICEILTSYLARKETEVMEYKLKNQEILSGLAKTEEIHRKEKEDLQAVIDKVQLQLQPENSKLQAANEELMQCRINLEKTFTKLAGKESELREARKALNKENETFINMTRKLKDLKQQVSSLSIENMRIQTENAQKNINYEHLGDDLHTAILRLKQTQSAKSNLSEELRHAEERVQALNIRAAVAFNDFTPRPSLSDFEAELGIVFRPKQSTADKCKTIMVEVQNIKRRLLKVPKRIFEPNIEITPDY